jgi:uncharacterized protein YndB with AHSA1/START domain
MTEPRALSFTRTVNAPIKEAFRAFTHATALRDWLSEAASAEPRKAGHIFLNWNDGYYACGTFTQFNPPHELVFTWDGFQEPGVMEVAVSFSEQNGGTLVQVVHGGMGAGAEWQDTLASIESGWTEALENLQSFLEQGIDLRVARRPRLGIFMDYFNSERAAKMGVPVSEGVLIEGTADGSGAQAAGLQKNDILVSLNGVPLADPGSFGPALKGLKAGDKPLVEFYRGAEKHSVPLTLGSFPIPDLPGSPAELAKKMRADYLRVRQTIESLVSGLSEEQAAKRPAEHEWSVKELIGHFVLCERDFQSWAADMLHDNVIRDDLQFRPNSTERIDALVTRLGSVRALLDELALAAEETCGLLETLPDDFTRYRKHFYRRLVLWESEVATGHFDSEHAEQFKQTIEAAKGV